MIFFFVGFHSLWTTGHLAITHLKTIATAKVGSGFRCCVDVKRHNSLSQCNFFQSSSTRWSLKELTRNSLSSASPSPQCKIQSFMSNLPIYTELTACFSRSKSDVKDGLDLIYICFALFVWLWRRKTFSVKRGCQTHNPECTELAFKIASSRSFYISRLMRILLCLLRVSVGLVEILWNGSATFWTIIYLFLHL